jgi:hypothetical protein
MPLPSPPAVVAPASAHPFHVIGLPALLGGTACDIGSTLWALQHPGVYEANPLYGRHPSAVRLLVTSAAVTFPAVVLLESRAHHGHPRLALWMAVALGSFHASLAIHNLRVGH